MPMLTCHPNQNSNAHLQLTRHFGDTFCFESSGSSVLPPSHSIGPIFSQTNFTLDRSSQIPFRTSSTSPHRQRAKEANLNDTKTFVPRRHPKHTPLTLHSSYPPVASPAPQPTTMLVIIAMCAAGRPSAQCMEESFHSSAAHQLDYQRSILLGLLFSVVGDVCLMLRKQQFVAVSLECPFLFFFSLGYCLFS